MLRCDVRLCPVRVLFVVLVTFFWLAGCGDDTEDKLPTGKPCQNNTDCADNMCHDGLCASADPKDNGASCTSAAECKSYVCSNSTCAPGTKPLGSTCLQDLECGSGSCSGGVCASGTGPDAGVDAAQPDGAQPDGAQPDAAQPDGTQPDAGQPDTAQPDGAQLDAAQPDAAQPDAAQPDAVQPDTAQPDTAQPDACVPGGACTPTNPCKTGEYQCPGGVLTCVETGNVAEGTSCGTGKSCQAGVCAACGSAENLPCCSGACVTNLACVGGVCQCGAKDEPCCGGLTCDANLTCDASTLCSCGKDQEPCCGGTTCDTNLACAGAACGCIVSASGVGGGGEPTVLKADGTVLNFENVSSTYKQVMTSTTSPLSGVTQVANFGFAGGCGLKADGTVWCWCANQLNSCNYYGTLGLGHFNDPTSLYLSTGQVLISAGVPLSDVTSVVAATGIVCAVKTDNTLWCWGDGTFGVLGNGLKANSAYAVQVLSASGGPGFSNVSSVALDLTHACAVRTDGSLWCWGDNTEGQLGIGTTTESLYPKQVSALFNNVAQASVDWAHSCAVTNNGEVWCWGDNQWGQLGNGLQTGNSTTPSQVLTSLGGSAFTGAKVVHATTQGACAGKGDGKIWCWGVWFTNLTPTQFATDKGLVTDVWRWGRNNTSPWWIKTDGLLRTYFLSTETIAPIACP